ncbi:MAG TPA: GEVED domain-containing protein, partial [Bacteroidia bacterium]|nr:GEVED domain-containing protein [Bacteroidia bacterium]
ILITIIIYVFTAKANAQTILLQEDFTGNTLPAGWAQDSAGFVPINNWKFNINWPVYSGGGFDSDYAVIEGDISGPFDVVKCGLITPAFNTLGFSSLYLSYGEIFTNYGGSQDYVTKIIELSLDSGLTWQVVDSGSYDHYAPPFNGIRNVIKLFDQASGAANTMVKFIFESENSGYWAIDNVIISDSATCTSPPDNGIAVSNVTYACNGTSLGLSLENLSRGIGQIYQWQKSSDGVAYNNIPGSFYDTLTALQSGTSYYKCMVTCGGLSTNSLPVYVSDTPRKVVLETLFDQNGICPLNNNIKDTIKIQSHFKGNGVTYQWLSNDSTNWWNTLQGNYLAIAGATDSFYVADFTNHQQTSYFVCDLICVSGGNKSRSNERTSYLNINPFCYCTPLSSNACSNNNEYYSFVGITGTTLNHTPSCVDTIYATTPFTNEYQFFSPSVAAQTATLTKGNTYSFNFTQTYHIYHSYIWIDYNQNSFFETDEAHYLGYSPNSNQQYGFNFTVPQTALAGQTGLRLRGHRYWGLFDFDSTAACTPLTNGATYDYIVTIDSTVGIADLGIEIGDLRLMPNPAKNEVTVTSDALIKELAVINTKGETIIENKAVNGFTKKVSTANLPNGVYMLMVETHKGRAVRRLVVVR